MKSFSFFVFLNVLILFTYAQNQTFSPNTCEQNFLLIGQTCTPCQQALFKHDSNPSIFDQTLPSDKCLASKIFFYHFFLNPSIPATSGTPDARISQLTKKAIEDLDKTCADTANNACNESDAKNSYTVVAEACDAELNQYLSSNNGTGTDTLNDGSVGSITISTMLGYYLAIPDRENLCLKVNGEYCTARKFKNYAILSQANQTQTPQPNTFSHLSCDDECIKQSYNNIKSFQSSHPPDIPNLQKIIVSTYNPLKEYENSCPNITSSIANSNNSIASSELEIKSDGQKLTNQFYNYSGIILIGLFYVIYK